MRRLIVTAVLALALCALIPAAAGAAFSLGQADVYFSEEDGSAASVAGSHPFEVATTFKVDSNVAGGLATPSGSLRDLEVQLPLGLAGIPTATPRCTGAEFAELDVNALPQPLPECPNDSVIGTVNVGGTFEAKPPADIESAEGGRPLYNLVPGPGAVAKFGFIFLKVPVTIDLHLSEEAPYRVIASITNAAQPLLLYGSRVTVWGDPAASVHDPYRGRCLKDVEPDGTPLSQGLCPVDPETPNTAFLTAPRACQGPLTSLFTGDSWEEPGVESSLTATTHDAAGNPLGFGGCGELGFSPGIGVSTSTGEGESPTGLDFAVEFNGNEGVSDPSRRADSDLRKIVAELPVGVTLNPSAANGLAGCTTAQLHAERLASPPGAGCPEASKIGTVTATSPLIEEALHGSIYVAEPDDPTTTTPGQENPFDSFLGIYLVMRNQKLGVIVKQAGKVEADPRTGRLSATFDDAPQLPITRISTSFRAGPRAPLVTPRACGAYTAEAPQTSWAGRQVMTKSSLTVGSGPGGSACLPADGPLAPGLAAGTTANGAGTYAPFDLHLTRRDGEANLTHLSVALPPGLTGKLAGVGLCPEQAIAAIGGKTGRAELASPSCPASSRIGSVTAGAGVGPDLTYVGGVAYLAGPYLGGPYSILVVTPAVAGPFDLGNVVVREPLRVDPFTAQVTVDGSAAPLPRVLKGIPLQLRDLRVHIDRPGFTLNPTSCDPKQITAGLGGAGPSLTSTGARSAAPAVRYQAANCTALAFKPKLALRLKGATGRIGHPSLKAVVTFPRRGAYANIARAQVNLPHSEFLDQGNLNKTCTRPVLMAGACPRSTVYGHAKAWTPLLDRPLQGPVYLVGGFGYKLPALVAELDGQIRVLLVGKVDSGKNRGIRNTFEVVPDAPVSRFVLKMKGGKKYGLLENSEDLCKAKKSKRRAIVRFRAQNGRVRQWKPVVRNQCKKKKSRKKRGGHHQGRHRQRHKR